MSNVQLSEKDFFRQQASEDTLWKPAIGLAFLLHVVLLYGSLYLPQMFESKPLFEEIITVDLVSMPLPERRPVSAPAEPPKQVASKSVTEAQDPPPEPEEVIPEKEIAIPEPEPPVVVEAKPVSVKPKRRKIKKAKDTRLAEEREREKLAAQNRIKARQEQLRKQQERERRKRELELKRSQQRADAAAKRAREELATMYKEQAAMRGQGVLRRSPTRRGRGSAQVNSDVFKQYIATLYQQVQSYWILPEMKKWDSNLEAVVVVTIDRSGRVLRTAFERKSNDPFFDQFVIKTINSAAPMPRFPQLMQEATLEVGLRFRPGELVM
ncbi:MAG: hypothetical protein CSA33_02600 [Desulfobulbus propionicus]|nr:MAG: hypothetical protein CSA33_02600 [Desulfobulbus propionicus]